MGRHRQAEADWQAAEAIKLILTAAADDEGKVELFCPNQILKDPHTFAGWFVQPTSELIWLPAAGLQIHFTPCVEGLLSFTLRPSHFTPCQVQNFQGRCMLQIHFTPRQVGLLSVKQQLQRYFEVSSVN